MLEGKSKWSSVINAEPSKWKHKGYILTNFYEMCW